jgi:hypothetical protein
VPFLFAEHFRIPSRHASLAELDPELEARDPLRRLAQLRWLLQLGSGLIAFKKAHAARLAAALPA